jgi:Domain of unknown function (DUF4157)
MTSRLASVGQTSGEAARAPGPGRVGRRGRTDLHESNGFETATPSVIGKRTQIESPVQRKERYGSDTLGDGATHTIANAGIQGGSGALPHQQRIQALFGRHDVSGISAHVGGPAAGACDQLGATAYASGNHVAFAAAPDLHTAAHEAAHVVQQRGGVSLKGGVGAAGDNYERHADAVADRVVAGQSAESLLDGAPGQGATQAVQRHELPDETPITAESDWHVSDRIALGGTFETANLFNLRSGLNTEYTRIEERRDFYRWFYNYTSARGYTTRWALAASLVANGANQVAHMDVILQDGAQLVGAVTDELQGLMRIGNQVIFDNVFPKLQALLDGGPLSGPAALAWDMQVLAEEQQLIQALYDSVAPETITALENVAHQQGFASIGAWITNGGAVAAGPFNQAGSVPPFSGDDITDPNDRWRYGMELGNTFAPEPTGYTDGMAMPSVSESYTSGDELAAVNTRANLHMLEACIDGHEGDPDRTLSLLRALTPSEQAEFNTDVTADGLRYSTLLARAGFMIIDLHVYELPLADQIPEVVGGFTGGPGPQAFLDNYNREVEGWREAANVPSFGSPPMGFGWP